LYVYLDPYRGGAIAVAEAARNVACTGARPVGMSNCLNYGNPMKPEIFWQFHQSVLGLIESCKTLEIPVTGGNVSFYNESPQAAVFPTPTITIVGLLDNLENRVPSSFQNEGDLIFIVGETKNEIGASHYLMVQHGLQKGVPPTLDLKREKNLQQFLIAAAAQKQVNSAHDTSEGGLAFALAECCLKSEKGLGAVVDGLELIRHSELRDDALYFGESQSRVIISVNAGKKESVIKLAMQYDLPILPLGKVFGKELMMDKLQISVEKMKQAFNSAIPNIMEN
jgi:phosphoribosylformylglycinamidine synthase